MSIFKTKKFIGFLLLTLILGGFLMPLTTNSADPTIKLSLDSENGNTKNGNYRWAINIDTTGVTNNTGIKIQLLEKNNETGQINKIQNGIEKITNNYASYLTGPILYPKTTYYVVAIIPEYNNLKATFLKETPDGTNIQPPIVIQGNPTTAIGSQNPVIVTPQSNQQAVDTDTTYTPLAKLPGFEGSFDTKPSPSNPCPFGKYINVLIKLFIGIAAVLAMVMIIIGGIQYMTSDLISSKEAGKKMILNAVLGLILALGSWAILNTLNPQLLKACLGNLPEAKITIDNETELDAWNKYSNLSSKSNSCKEGYVNVKTYGNPQYINVCKSVSVNLKNIIEKAKKEGIILSGYGSRSYNEQVNLRKKHNCPDVFISPSNQCKPPTARPGYSKHESGKAVDFNCNGKSMSASGGKNSKCFIWLSKNGPKNGFYNLKSEPWHWSDDGR